MSAADTLDARSLANMLDYHRRQLNRALLEQAEWLESGATNELDLRVATTRIAQHAAVIDLITPWSGMVDALAEPPAWPPTQAVTEILAWLDAAPEDWPWTGQDIAAMIRDGCPDWTSPGVETKPRTVKDVVEWLEQRPSFEAKDAPRQIAADIRLQFGMDAPLPSLYRGLVPGDVCNTDGWLLNADGHPDASGTVWVTRDQAARAAVFGWKLDVDMSPHFHDPNLVAVKR